MFRIGEFSKLGKVTIKTLRFYDEAGLLNPAEVDKFTGYRKYTTEQLVILHKIQSLRQIGISLGEISSIINGADIEPVLAARKADLTREIAYSREQLSRIDFILSKKEKEMNYQAIIKQLPECIVYSKKMTVPSYDAYFEVLPALGEKFKNKYPDLKCTKPGYCFIIYLDEEYKDKDINVEYCEAVNGFKPDFDGIVFKKINSVTAVSVMHKGAYSGLSNAYAYAFKWIEQNGYKASDYPRESYIDGIWNKESEEDWLTELQIPVSKI